MKYLNTFFLFFLFGFSHAQPVLSWMQAFNDSLNDFSRPYVLQRGINDEMIIGGESTDSNYNNNRFIAVSIDNNGSVLWNKSYSDTTGYNSRFVNIVVDRFNNTYLTGQYNINWAIDDSTHMIDSSGIVTQSIGYQPFVSELATANDGTHFLFSCSFQWIDIAKYDLNGNIIDSIHIDTTSKNVVKMLTDFQGNIFLTGTASPSHLFVKKFDSTLVFLWEQLYATSNIPIIKDVKIDEQGSIYLLFRFFGGAQSDVVKYDSAGNFKYNISFQANFNYPQNLYVTTNDLYITRKANLSGIYDNTLDKYNKTTGSFCWQAVSDSAITPATFLNSCLATNDEKYIYWACEKKMSPTETDFILFKYDSSGNKQWEIPYSVVGSNDFPIDMFVDTASCIHLLVRNNEVIKAFKYCDVQSIDEASEAASLQVSPNPAQAQISIRGLQNSVMTQLKITDITGRKVYSQSVKSTTHDINVAAFPQGIYFVTASSVTNFKIAKFIKE